MAIFGLALFLLFPLIGWALGGLWGAIIGIVIYVVVQAGLITHSMITEPWKWPRI